MAKALQAETQATDPRILRTRRMLMDALAKLLKEEAFEQISVQEIADEATLNRNTFYLHYQDKVALLQAMTEFRFRDLIERRGISFEEITSCSAKGALIPLEGSIIPVVEGMFMEGVAHHAIVPGIAPALIATTAAWAVFGAARRWHQSPDRIPAEEMAAKIEAMVKPVFLNSFE